MHVGSSALAVLGLEPGATRDDIAHAYRRLALLIHPDVSRDPLAAQRFTSLTDAYRHALDEAATHGSTTTSPSRRPRPYGRQFVAGPVHVVPHPLRPSRGDS